MKRILLSCAGIALALSASAVPGLADTGDNGFRRPEPFAFARKATPKGVFAASAELGRETLLRRFGLKNPDMTLDISDEVGYLEGPNDQIWYYVAQYEYKITQHEYYTEKRVIGFTFTIFDTELKKIGQVHDAIRLKEDEVATSAVSLDPQITKSFFNTDDKYEIVVGIANVTGDHVVNTYSIAYSIGGSTDENGNSKVLAEIPGYIIDAVDTAPDRWSEKYFITFLTEAEGNPDDYDDYLDFLATYRNVMTTYKYGGYSAPSVISTLEIPMVCMPGDGMSTPFLFSKKGSDGKYYFFTQQYEKSFFVDPTGMGGNEDLTPDNSLIIQPYTIDSPWVTSLTPGTPVKIKVEKDPDYLCSYYGLGNMLGEDDVDITTNGTPSEPSFYVTVQNYTSLADETYTSMYYMYNASGTRVATLSEYAEAVIPLTDIKGRDPEVLFVTPDLNNYSFNIVNLRTRQTTLSIPSVYEGLNLTTNFDRRPAGDSYEYVCELRNGYDKEDGTYVALIANIAPDGTIKPSEEINLGKNVAYAQFYIEGSALTPYVFNTDDKNEYMALVKRYTEPEVSTAAEEELIVISADEPEPLLVAGPDSEKGVLATVMLTGEGTSRRLMVVYMDDDYRFTQDIYKLPLTCFAGGDGSAANPYQIATVGDLQGIAKNPDACYEIISDFDAANYPFECIASFGGKLDGKYHTITNLNLSRANGSVGLFIQAQDADIRNINFDKPVVELNASNLYSGLVAATLSGDYAPGQEMPTGATLDDIHVYGLKVIGSEFNDCFGGLVGRLTLASTVSNSYVKKAAIWLPTGSAAGIAGEMLTGSGVTTCAFSGDINGASGVAGIAASASKGCILRNNHATGYLVAENTIGGIVGSSSRATVENNIFYGCITATTPNRWAKNVAAGGIIGQLEGPTTDDTDPDAICVRNNIADITQFNVPTLSGTEEWAGQLTTAHRIVGWTRINARLYEGDTQAPADKGLENNYATGALTDPVDKNIAASGSTTEGETISSGDVNDLFLAGLGFAHGTTADSPWNVADAHPSLHFENSIVIEKPQIRAENLNETFNVPVVVTSRFPLSEADLTEGLVTEYDESHLQMTGKYTYDGRTLALEIRPLKEGLSRFVVRTCGSKASTRIITGAAGVSDIDPDNNDNAPVEYFNLQGVRLDKPTPGTVVLRRQGNHVTKIRVL